MTLAFLLYLAAGAFAGGFVNGLAGFGTALFALGFWLQIMPPAQAVAVVVAMSVVSGAQGVWVVRRDIQRARLLRFLIPALVGVPAGVGLLALIDVEALKLVIAGFLMLYGGFFLVNRNLPHLRERTPVMDSIIGAAGGVLGGAAGLSGALPTMWCALKDWTKGEKRALFQPFNLSVLGLTVAFLAVRGEYTVETLTVMAAALPVTIVSAQAGIFVFKRLSDAQFRTLLIALLFISGATLMFRTLAL